MAVVDQHRLRRILTKMLDEQEFLSPFGIRALSRFHKRHPYTFRRRPSRVSRGVPAGRVGQRHVRRQLELARPGLDADERAPHPRAAAVLHVLRRLVHDRMSHRLGTRDESLRVAKRSRRGSRRIFLRGKDGRRPVYGGTEIFQTDPHWRDHLLFYEYFHGDNGAGLGASHQTGWTGLVATLIRFFGAVGEEFAGAWQGSARQVGTRPRDKHDEPAFTRSV